MRMIQQSWAWYTHNTILRYFEIGFAYQICLETLIVCMWMGQPLRVSHMNRGEQHSATPTVAQLCWCENQDFDPDPNEVDGRNHPQNGWQAFTRIYMDSHGVIGMMLLEHPTEKEDLGSPWNRGCWAFQIVSFGTKHECIQCMYCPSIPVCLPVCLSRSTPKPAKYADACSLVDIHRYPRTINELFFSWSFMTYPVYESWTSWVSNDLLVILCLGTVLYPLLYNIIWYYLRLFIYPLLLAMVWGTPRSYRLFRQALRRELQNVQLKNRQKALPGEEVDGSLHIGAIRSLFRTYSACWSGLWSVVLTRFDTDWTQGDRWQLSPTCMAKGALSVFGLAGCQKMRNL